MSTVHDEKVSFALSCYINQICAAVTLLRTASCVSRYNTEGHVVNVTFPTAEVSSFHNSLEKSVRVEVDSSNSENFITVTNFSSSDTIFTIRQGMPLNQPWLVMYN